MPDDFALDWAGGEGGVGDGAFDCAGLQGADFVPLGAGEADAGEACLGFAILHYGAVMSPAVTATAGIVTPRNMPNFNAEIKGFASTSLAA